MLSIGRILYLLKNKDTEFYRKLGVTIGKNVHILNSHIDEGYPYLISIGDDVTITRADILAHDASTLRFLDGHVKVGKVTIGNNVFIGHGCVVLPGTVIGDNVICGANTMINGNVPSNVVIGGNPYRIICSYDEYVKKHKENMSESNTYSTPFASKTDIEKQKMMQELDNNGIGYSK